MLVRSARLVVPYLGPTATGMHLLARSSRRRRQPVPERSLGYSARALVRFSPQSAWPDATKASNLVVVRIGADDDFAAGVDCVRSVKRIAGCKSRIRHEFDGLPRYRPVGNRKLEIQLVNRLPQSIESGAHPPHDCGSRRPQGRDRALVAPVSKPGQDRPVGQFIQNQSTHNTALASQFGFQTTTPCRYDGVVALSQMQIQEIRIEVAPRHSGRVARSSPGSVSTSQSPPSIRSISSREAIPAAPAVAAQRSFRLAGLRRQSWPGSTPSASASRPIVSRSTRVA